ncbi:histidine phosphotransferase family protein [Terricaulis sp.]|jgi:histidine phosphotransferase ChpT|uniref:histidine phosphotransferase family protein n=1 Tax=Terricaulis sp. TaxID=2768686 RepID=UPI002AC7270E|nr:histidine phosphotransferase family protein [Terricaulis sp.]MDZ4691784.1 histidine phosphotransferase family protein [Terricaulis sp.]
MIENTKLTALVASRICHDMVEPMSAIIQGLEMIKSGDGKPDPDAVSLLDHGVGKAWAKLEFFRFAMAGATAEGDSELEEGRAVAIKLYSVLKPELVWAPPPVQMPRPAVRVIVNLLLIANECLPRGGTVTVTAEKHGEGGEVIVTAAGPRAKLREPTAAALRGGEDDLSGHTIQPTLTSLLARQGGVELSTRESEEKVEFIARSAAFKL